MIVGFKEMRSINFPFPYENGTRLSWVSNVRQNIVELHLHSRISNHALISSKCSFLYSKMAILKSGKKFK